MKYRVHSYIIIIIIRRRIEKTMKLKKKKKKDVLRLQFYFEATKKLRKIGKILKLAYVKHFVYLQQMHVILDDMTKKKKKKKKKIRVLSRLRRRRIFEFKKWTHSEWSTKKVGAFLKTPRSMETREIVSV